MKGLLIFMLLLFSINICAGADKMVNLGVGFLLTSEDFKEPFSMHYDKNNNEYYRMPDNTWNDYTYFSYSADWKLKWKLRYGWGMEFCFGGSGGDSKDSIKVDSTTDLGQAYGGDFYAIYNSYHIPVFANILLSVLNIKKYTEIFIGISAGEILGIFTYNELIESTRNSLEESAEKTFFTANFMYQIFGMVKIYITESLNPVYFMLTYRIAENPILTNDFLNSGNTTRRIQFQSNGLILGFGFRY